MAESHRDEITKLEALYSDNPEGRVFTLLAEAYRKAGELDHAREVLEGGIKRHTGYASAYVVLGRVLLDQQQGPAAEDAFKRVLELDPENLVALRALGDRARNTGRQQEAIKYYRELLMLDPSDEELQETVATLQKEIGAQETSRLQQPAAAEPMPGWNAPAQPPSGSRDSLVGQGGDFGNISIDGGGLSLPDNANFGDISMQSGSGNMLSLDETPAPDPGGSFSLDSSDAEFTGLGGMDLGGSMDLGGGDAGTTTSSAGAPPDEFGTLPDFGGFSLDTGAAPAAAAPAAQPAFDAGDDVGLPPLSFEPLEDASVAATDLPMLDEPPSPAVPAETLSWSPDPVDMLDTPVAGESLSVDSFRPFAPPPEEPAAFPFTTDGVVEPETEALETWTPDQLLEDTPAAATPHVGPVDDLPWAAPAEEPEAPAPLATETMAELYMGQGLHARAIDVYRALLRERPDDERLYTKLRQAEFALSSAIARETPKAKVAPVEEEVEPESAWTAAPSTAGQEQTPYAWAQEEEPDSGPQIGAYFSSLLAWQPANPRPRRQAPPQVAVPEATAGPNVAGRAAPLAASAQQGQSAAEAAAEADTDLSWLDDPVPAPAPPRPAPAPAAPPAAPPAAAAATEDDLAWLFEDEAAAAAAKASPAAAPEKPDAAAEPEGGGDDDDLEMFRAWLQSLKR